MFLSIYSRSSVNVATEFGPLVEVDDDSGDNISLGNLIGLRQSVDQPRGTDAQCSNFCKANVVWSDGEA